MDDIRKEPIREKGKDSFIWAYGYKAIVCRDSSHLLPRFVVYLATWQQIVKNSLEAGLCESPKALPQSTHFLQQGSVLLHFP